MRNRMKNRLKPAWPVVANLADKNIFLFLDFDGTLSPIAESPEKAVLPERTRSILKRLALLKSVKIAVISGRPVDEVRKITGIEGLIYAGSHGKEIKGGGMDFSVPVSKNALAALGKAKAAVKRELAGVKGLIIENKKAAFSVHYRMAGQAKKKTAENAVRNVAGKYVEKGLLGIKKGKMVIEAVAGTGWDKGRAALKMIEMEKEKNTGRAANAVYIGDDLTDFDAFKALEGRGISIFIGKPGKAPKSADYYLKNTFETAVFLARLAAAKGGEKK